MKGLIVTGKVDCSVLPFWLGIVIEEYGCEGLGHHGLKFCLELGFIEFMLCFGRRYSIKPVEKEG